MKSQEALLRDALQIVSSGATLSAQQSHDVVEALMQVDLERPPFHLLAAGLLCALKTRGEVADEIAGAARCLRAHQVPVGIATSDGPLLDTCGTGGDGAHLINISTLAALVTASLGVRVAKHGNRSVSSACGSADLLEALGYPLSGDPDLVIRCVSQTGFGFLFAPHFHPALKNLANLRKVLGVRTMFNMLGPLVNPAVVSHQLLGVFDRDLVEPLARASAQLGLERGLIVHGEDGLDELSPSGVSWVAHCQDDHLTTWEWTPDSFAAPSVSLDRLRGGNASDNARISRRLLAGHEPEVAIAVSMNVAAALWLTDIEPDLKSGFRLSMRALSQGSVGAYFERCLEFALATQPVNSID